MSEKRLVAQRRNENINASIWARDTVNGEMRTITLDREWIGNDGDTMRTGELRLRDIPAAVDLLRMLATAHDNNTEEGVSEQENPLHDLPAAPRIRAPRKKDLSPMRVADRTVPTGYASDNNGACHQV